MEDIPTADSLETPGDASMRQGSQRSVSPKHVYRERFDDLLPSVEDVSGVLVSLFMVDVCAIYDALELLECIGEEVANKNLFTCLWFVLVGEELETAELEMLRSFSRCFKRKQSVCFLDKTLTKLLSICSKCYRNPDLKTISQVSFSRSKFTHLIDLKLVYQWQSITNRPSKLLGNPYISFFEFSVQGGDDVDISNLCKPIVERVADIEKYHYTIQKSCKGEKVYLVCSMRRMKSQCLKSDKPLTGAASQSQPKKRKTEPRKTQECGGRLSVRLSNDKSLVLVYVSHSQHHEDARPRMEFNEDHMAVITNMSDQGSAPFQIASTLQRSTSELFSWRKVYYQWKKLAEARLKRNSDPFLSTKALIRTCQNISLCFTSENPKAIGFTTSIGSKVAKKYECAKAFIDSTYKTNGSGMELFAIMTSVFGTGVPVAYMFLTKAADHHGAILSRPSIIGKILHSVREALLDFRPKFFLRAKTSDKLTL